jgi:hypothetical protein
MQFETSKLDTGIEEIRMLSSVEIDATSGAGIFSSIGKFLKSIFSGPGDRRRPTDRIE